MRCRSSAPILDAGCGYGRNAAALAARGMSVVCADHDWKRLQVLARFGSDHAAGLTRPGDHPGRLHTLLARLESAFWPFGEKCFSGIVCVHFLNITLFGAFRSSLIEGGFLYIETFGGHGENHLALPKAGELRSLLSPDFDLPFYEERKVGPAGYDAVAVKLGARKRLMS
jgi:SAM-dependent methyltransferase